MRNLNRKAMNHKPRLARVIYIRTDGRVHTMYNGLPFGVAQQRRAELIARGYDHKSLKVTYAN